MEDNVLTIQYPSQAFPVFPQIQLDIPTEWEETSAPGSLLAVKHEYGNESFSPNVILTISRDEPSISLADAVKTIKAYIESLGTSILYEQAVKLDGKDWYVAEFGRVVEKAGTIIQIVATTVITNGPVTDVVRLTGSAASNDYEAGLKEVREIIASVKTSL